MGFGESPHFCQPAPSNFHDHHDRETNRVGTTSQCQKGIHRRGEILPKERVLPKYEVVFQEVSQQFPSSMEMFSATQPSAARLRDIEDSLAAASQQRYSMKSRTFDTLRWTSRHMREANMHKANMRDANKQIFSRLSRHASKLLPAKDTTSREASQCVEVGWLNIK
jgi:hypothetical protein